MKDCTNCIEHRSTPQPACVGCFNFSHWAPLDLKAADAACDGANKTIAEHAEGNLSNSQLRAVMDAINTGTGVLKTESIPPKAWFTMPEMQKLADDNAAKDALVRAHPLYPIFIAAIEQAMYGKGQRHGGNVTPFLDQPWAHYFKMHGRGFLTGQAAKKLEEAASTRNGEGFETEVFGALVYIGMAVLSERGGIQ